MKILAISDEECAALWDYYTPGKLKGYDLIIACGDLKADYLSFLVTVSNIPVLYVHGNHDEGYLDAPPEGCDCIDGHYVEYNGLRILGLGGCLRYHRGHFQYTEAQMRRRVRRLKYHLWRNKGVDIVVTHAPPRGVGDGEDPAHRGFQALLDLVDKYQPQYLLHGHVHLRYGMNRTQVRERGQTQVINVGERHTIEIPDKPFREKHRGQVIFKTRQRNRNED